MALLLKTIKELTGSRENHLSVVHFQAALIQYKGDPVFPFSCAIK